MNKLVVFIFLFGFWSALFLFAGMFNIGNLTDTYIQMNTFASCTTSSVVCFPIFIWNFFVLLLAMLTYQIPNTNFMFITLLNVLGVINLAVIYLMIRGD